MNPADNDTEASLVRRAQNGDGPAFVCLYRRYVNELYAFLYVQTGCAEDAEDIVGETFLHAVQGLSAFEHRSTFRTWLYAIARNQLRDLWRRNGRRPTVPLSDRVADASADDPECRPEVTALGQAVFSALPERYRQVLELRIVDGRSVRDVATRLGTSVNNVKVLQHRALRRAADIARNFAGTDDGEVAGTDSGEVAGTDGGEVAGTDGGEVAGTDGGDVAGTDVGDATGTDVGDVSGTDDGDVTGTDVGDLAAPDGARQANGIDRLGRNDREHARDDHDDER